VRLVEGENWSEEFFTEYKNFRNIVHKNVEGDLPLELEDYRKFFGEHSVFHDFGWKAFVIFEENDRIGQAILTWKKGSLIGHLGFLDILDNREASDFLFNEIKKSGIELNLKQIKAPVDLNLFVKYRMRTEGVGEPFFGEPRYPEYYVNHLERSQFSIIGEWDTYQIKVRDGIMDFFSKRKTLSKKTKLKTTIRTIQIKKWDHELRIIYELFSEAYKKMPEFELISYEQFKVIYDPFKYIVQPWLSYIVELEGRPVGFSINFVDPLPLLKNVSFSELTLLQKMRLFLKIRMNRGTLLISHVGKIPGPGGEEIKGVQIKVSKKLTVFSLMMKKVLVTFQNKESPSRKSWNEKVQVPYSKYVLYGIDLK